MNSYLLRRYMDLISRPDVTPAIHAHTDTVHEERAGEEYYLLGWFPKDTLQYGRIVLYPGKHRVELNDKLRMWVPLDNICIELEGSGNRPRMRYEPIGSGGNHLVEFNDNLSRYVGGLKEAFQHALDAALVAEGHVVQV